MNSTIPPQYQPTDDEPFMNDVMLEYFRHKLSVWKKELFEDANITLQHLQEDTAKSADLADRATEEADRTLELRTRDRARKLILKIDEAIDRMEDGVYGYCRDTGEPIGVKRLQARPIATLGLEAQERHERLEKTKRD
jgi:DnaK suppressor protein